MNTVYQILARPMRSAVVLSTALAAVLVIFSVLSMFHFHDQPQAPLIPINTLFSLLTIAITVLPGLFLRLYCYSGLQIIMTPGDDIEQRKRKAAIVPGIAEFVYFLFIINAYLAAVTSGGSGFLGILALAVFHVILIGVFSVTAVYLYFRRGKKVVAPPTPKVLF